jgi:hypothetical protein
VLLTAACSSDNKSVTAPSTPTTPTPPPAPAPTTFTLSGRVTSAAGPALAGANVAILDGPNANRATSTDGAGGYSFTGLASSGFTVAFSAGGYATTTRPVSLAANVTTNVALLPAALFQKVGVGNQVFDIPSFITRARIMADYGGSCQNFILRINGRSLANEILGNCSIASGRHYDATVLTGGGTGDTVSSEGVLWSFTEVR